MNITELRELINVRLIHPKMVKILDETPDGYECLNILNKNGKWQVFYMEKGKTTYFREFDDEGSACDYFYQLMLKAGTFLRD